MTDIRAALRLLDDALVHLDHQHYGWGYQAVKDARAALAAASPEPERHRYSPDAMAMGDCKVCGHVYEDHQPAPAAPSVEARGDRGHRYDAEGHCIEQGCPYHITATPPSVRSGLLRTPEPEALRDDVDTLQWLVWFGRKSRGTPGEVVRRALEQNPDLRISERIAAARADERTRMAGGTDDYGYVE